MSKLSSTLQSTRALEAVFEQLAEAIVLYDKDLKISGINPAAEKLFGMTSEEMVGRDCREVFRCTSCENECGMIEGLHESGPSPLNTIRLHTDNGRERLAVIRTTPIYSESGEVDGVVAARAAAGPVLQWLSGFRPSGV